MEKAEARSLSTAKVAGVLLLPARPATFAKAHVDEV